MILKKIISGGETGADRGALDAAIQTGLEHGGAVARGRKAEDGRISEVYNLEELRSNSLKERTIENAIRSDGTIVFGNARTPRSTLTIETCFENGKPILLINSAVGAVGRIYNFVRNNNIETLNVTGNRESKAAGIQSAVQITMATAILQLKKNSYKKA